MQRVTLTDKKQLTHNVWELSFAPEQAIEYIPGQYARFTFLHQIADPRGKQHRTFSFTSHPSEPNIRFITRLDTPLSVFKQPLSELEPGASMLIDEPHGDAILPRLETTPVVFVAQGIALASYLSMLRDIALRELAHPVSLIWARRDEDSALSSRIPEVTTLKRTDFVYPKRLEAARVTQEATPNSLIYLSGSQTFVEILGGALETSGIPRERIIYDYYSGYTDL